MNPQSQSTLRALAALLTAMHTGRLMTLAFIGAAGSGLPDAPPAAWLMPLVGDAVIGALAPIAAWLVWRGRGPGVFATIVAFHAVGIWDALSAFLVHQSVPWPEFFMIKLFGASMFFAATGLHLVALGIVAGPSRGSVLDGSVVFVGQQADQHRHA